MGSVATPTILPSPFTSDFDLFRFHQNSLCGIISLDEAVNQHLELYFLYKLMPLQKEKNTF